MFSANRKFGYANDARREKNVSYIVSVQTNTIERKHFEYELICIDDMETLFYSNRNAFHLSRNADGKMIPRTRRLIHFLLNYVVEKAWLKDLAM